MPKADDDWWDLVFRLVPDHGVADTVQGELVRAVLRLGAECCREGCGNWDGYFEALADFAAERFADGTLDPTVAERAVAMLERLRGFGRDADGHTASACDELSRAVEEPLEAAAVQWCQRHQAPIPFAPEPDYDAQD